MKKRILSCLTALALCLTLLPAAALAADGESSTEPHTHSNWLASDYGTDAKTLVLRAGGPTNTYGDPLEKQGDGDWNLPAGNYYLKGDITVEYAIAISGDVTICLNGRTLESKGENMPVFRVEDGSTLTLTDCKGNAGKVKHTSDGSGSGVRVEGGGTFNMYGGTITGNKAETGGGVYVVGGTFTMSGGTISGNTADSTDGGVGVYSGAKFIMNGGEITGNTARYYSGGVGVYTSAKFIMSGGTIGGNTANDKSNGGNGGGVRVGNYGEFTMSGGNIADNTATESGGGVYMDGGTFTMSGGAISGNKATKDGGGVYVNRGCKFDMNGGTIGGGTIGGGNEAKGNGGGVYMYYSTFTMNDKASITGNKATVNGGGVCVFSNDNSDGFTMNDTASITGNTANQDGGGVCASAGKFNMNSTASVTNNTGNGVYVSDHAIFTVSDAPTVTGNTKNDDASNVYLTGSADITIGSYGLKGNANSIGVTKTTASTGQAPVTIATGSNDLNEDDAAKFESDMDGFAVSVDTKNKKQLVLKKEETQPSTHKHEWSYQKVGDATIKATCTNTTGDCNVNNNGGSVTIKASTTTYDGNEKLATVKKTGNWRSAFSENISIAYEEMNGDAYKKIDGVPTEVGKYKASITVGGQIAFVEYEITGGTPEKIPVTKITLSPASPVLTVGQTQAMTVVIEPRTATDQNLTWKSSDNSVATVENGTVTAKAPGTAEITATAVGGTDKSATCTVTVTGGSTGGTTGGSTGGSSGGSDSNPVIKTETKNNPDGSTTKTETRKDGSVTQTTTGKDGSTGTVKTDKHGQTEAKTALSNKAVEDAKKNGEAVKAPVEVEASRNSNTAPTVKVELPKGAGETKVEIPVSNVKPGTVAVLVHPDGTEEIVKNSVPTEDGIQLTVDGNATVKIIDNSKDFIDTRNHWAEDAIDFVSARGLVNGMSDTIYAPNNSATRAQLWTILARQNDANLSGGNTWYEKAQLWSKDKGISDGTEPNAAINRAQMVTMLWRTMGQPAATDKVSFADVPAGSYYAQAVAWAVENGITTGVGGGRFDPTGACTRAQIAAFLTRLYAEK